jgi:hypothetical protein
VKASADMFSDPVLTVQAYWAKRGESFVRRTPQE